MSTVDLDPFDVNARIPHEMHQEMRSTCPVARIPVGWFLTRHAEVLLAVRDVETFQSSYREPGVIVPEEEQILPEIPEPRHGRVRRLVNAVLAHHKAMRVEPFIRDLSYEYLEPLLDRGEGDLVAEYASPIPINVIAHMIGVPRADWPLFRQWSDEVVQGDYVNKNRTDRGEGFGGGHPEFAAYVDDLIAVRKASAERPDDLVTRLLYTKIEGDHLTDLEIRTQLISLILGGNETTRHLIANVLARVVEDPALLQTLKADPSRCAQAVEESLRIDPPIHQMLRTVAATTDRFGPEMCPGEKIIYAVASANRDEDVFDDPEDFRLERANGRDHLAFGDGPHICPGQAIARLEARVTLEVFVERVATAATRPGWTYRKVPIFWANGPIDLDVRLTPEPSSPEPSPPGSQDGLR
ncbi:MAG TPA: cytochrome P450 [Acidimicrobiales bacterium]